MLLIRPLRLCWMLSENIQIAINQNVFRRSLRSLKEIIFDASSGVISFDIYDFI